MSHMKDDADTSVSRDPVFDWGFSRDSIRKSADNIDGSDGASASASASATGAGSSSRYDPKTMSRIVDITDLVDDSSTDSDDDAIVGHSIKTVAGHNFRKGGGTMISIFSKRKKSSSSREGSGPCLMCRQVVILFSLVTIIVAAGFAVVYAVQNGGGDAARASASISSALRGPDPPEVSQDLLETGERINKECAESQLDQNMGECQKLCRDHLCCFEESGPYSCVNDSSKNCGAYGGCEALVEGIIIDGLVEEED